MRAFTCAIAVMAGLLWGGVAHAQFQNHTLGLSLGYMKLDTGAGLGHGWPLGLEASTYIDSGWEAIAHLEVMILTQSPSDRQVIGLSPTLGIHYLFTQEDFRPYAGIGVTYLHIFADTGVENYFGLAPNIGFDWFTSDSISIGLRAQYNLYLALNEPVENAFTIAFQAKTYF